MSKMYIEPSCKYADIDIEQVICGSKEIGYSNDAATHSDNPDEDVLVKQQSPWEDMW